MTGFRQLDPLPYERETPPAQVVDMAFNAHISRLYPSSEAQTFPLNLQAAKRQTDQFRTEIFSCRNELKLLVGEYEKSIGFYWSRKSITKRQRFISNLRPQMPTTKVPALAYVQERVKFSKIIDRKQTAIDRQSMLMPLLNLQDLCDHDGQLLLLLLSERVYHHPAHFGRSDFSLFELLVKHGLLPTADVPGHMVHVGLWSSMVPDVFGIVHSTSYLHSMLPYYRLEENNDGKFDIVTGPRGFRPSQYLEEWGAVDVGIALLVLEAQAILLGFLRDFTTKLIMSMPAEPRALQKKVVPLCLSSKMTPKRKPDTNINLEIAYSNPFGMITVVLDCLRVRRQAAIDHFVELRENPAILAEQLQEYRYRIDTIPELLECKRDDEHVRAVIMHAFERVFIWHDIGKNLELLQLAILAAVDGTNPLFTSAYIPTKAAFSLRIALELHARIIIEQDTKCLGATMKEFTKEMYFAKDGKATRDTKAGSIALEQFRLLLCISAGANSVQHYIGITNIFPILMKLLDRHTDGLRSVTATDLPDLTLIACVASFFDLVLPVPVGLGPNDLFDIAQGSYDFRIPEHRKIMTAINNAISFEAFDFPLNGKINYPSTKARTQARVNDMRAAEALLDGFWTKVDALIHEQCGISVTEILKKHGIKMPALERTPEWQAPEALSTETCEQMNAQAAALSDLHTASLESDLPRRAVPVVEKSKTKTRGKPTGGHLRETIQAVNETPYQAISQFKLDKRSYKVFKALFNIPSEKENEIPEVPWTEFTHAMVAMGFAVQSVGGSRYHFTPNHDHGIEFHRPHPEPKLSAFQARHFGRRLHRRYGWTGEMFVRASRADKEA